MPNKTLTAAEIRNAKPGFWSDSPGLYLRVQESGAKSWTYRFQLNGKRREMGLGALDDVPAPMARERAAEARALLRRGIDPLTAREQESMKAASAAAQAKSDAVTFDTVAAEYIASHRAGWANEKHAGQWETTLDKYARPVIGSKPVGEVNTADVLRILQPIWAIKTETASRVRSRVELVLSYAKAKGLRQGENPAVWRGHLDALLPKPSKVAKVRHMPALPHHRMSQFMTALRGVGGVGARAIEFAILTAARSGEVRLMTMAEVDFDNKLWTVPARRMKMKREHRVPLSDAAIELLKSMTPVEGNPYVFPATRGKVAISDMTMTRCLRRMNEGKSPAPWIDPRVAVDDGNEITTHGFRSTFRDWVGEETEFPRELAELALAHGVGGAVERAYARSDLLERRRELMQAWALHVVGSLQVH